VKPPPFIYRAPTSLAEALSLLREHGEDGKVLAGGQSLVPMLNFRLLRPSVLIDINRVPELTGIGATGFGLRIGALTRHRETAGSALIAAGFPVLTEAMTHVAHLTVRNRGTFGGSLAHADPAAELPLIAILLGAHMTLARAEGSRRLPADKFFVSALTTALQPDELLVAVDLPALPPRTGWGFAEFARRHGDYALAAVGVTLRVQEGVARDVRIAATGVGDTPLRLAAAEQELDGQHPSDGALDRAVAALRAAIEPNGDLNASAAYRRHLAGVLARRAVTAAWERAAA